MREKERLLIKYAISFPWWRKFAQHSERAKCNSVAYSRIISSVNISYYIYLFICVDCVYVCMCNLARGGQMAISAVSFFLPMQFLCIKVRALGLHGTSAFTSWAIFLASTSSFMKGLKPLSFLRRCHLSSVLFVFTKQNWTDVKMRAPIFGQRWRRVWRWSRDPGWAAVQKSLTLELGAPADRGMGPFLSSQEDR